MDIAGNAARDRTDRVLASPRTIVEKGAAVRTFIHRVGSKLDYGVDWSDWLGPLAASPSEQSLEADIITDSQWAAAPAGLTITGGAIGSDGRQTRAFIEGGTAGTVYAVTNSITTSLGRTESRTFNLIARPGA